MPFAVIALQLLVSQGLPSLGSVLGSVQEPADSSAGFITGTLKYQDRNFALQVLGSLLRVRTLVHQHTAKHDEDRMTHFLYAAARGDTELIQQVGTGLSQRGAAKA